MIDRLAGQGYHMDEVIKLIKNPKATRIYAHFDRRTSFWRNKDRILDPDFIASYAFYPLIEKDMRRIKWKSGQPVKDPRPIRYAAHLDRCIYQYYAALLNERYNRLAVDLGIDECAIAYRTNKKGMSNCEFAARAFSEIRAAKDCYVKVGDFKSFFETLDHVYLKQRVRDLFEDEAIPDDYYHVLKNATKYTVWNIEDLLVCHGLPYSKSGVKRLNKLDRVLDLNNFRRLVKTSVAQPWKENGGKGIPQGLPISGVLANIYMVQFDLIMNDAAEAARGFYMRYSDDFIFAAPGKNEFQALCNTFEKALSTVPKLVAHPDKCKSFCCSQGKVASIDNDLALDKQPIRHIDYLGFSFDGTSVRLRQRTVGRYYRRMYRRVATLYGGSRRPSKRRVDALYIDFSDWGRCPNRNRQRRVQSKGKAGNGNFLTYAGKAQRVFPEDPILVDTKRHKRKLRVHAGRAKGKRVSKGPQNIQRI